MVAIKRKVYKNENKFYFLHICSEDHVKRREVQYKLGLVLLPMVLYTNKKDKYNVRINSPLVNSLHYK